MNKFIITVATVGTIYTNLFSGYELDNSLRDVFKLDFDKNYSFFEHSPQIEYGQEGLTIKSKLKVDGFLRRLEVDEDYREKAQSIKELYCDKCDLVTLHQGIRHLKNLVSLSLENNLLTSLPRAIVALKDLKFLSIAKNKFEKFPDCLLDLQSELEVLSMDPPLFTQMFQELRQFKKKLSTDSIDYKPTSHLPT
ncbi:leucine-rich repeat domain-containing protein [bacterium]|nr:leucine-rich repeat domain-containing protein [bacterium]